LEGPITATDKGSGPRAAALVYSIPWPIPSGSQRILTAFAALTRDDFSRHTHFFGGRFENLYLDRDRIPELRIIPDQAERWAREILDWGDRPLRCGFWFNAQGPGQATSEHTHEELDELCCQRSITSASRSGRETSSSGTVRSLPA